MSKEHDEVIGGLTVIANNVAALLDQQRRTNELLARIANASMTKPTSTATRPATTARSSSGGGTFVLRFGKSKGKKVGEAPLDDLEWMARVLDENVRDPAKSQYRQSNEDALHAVETEIGRRNGGPTNDDDFGPPPVESSGAVASGAPDGDDIPFIFAETRLDHA